MHGKCEVYPDQPCVWYAIYQRSRLLHRTPMLERVLPELDWSLVGTSSWINHLAGRDAHIFRDRPPVRLKAGESKATGSRPSHRAA